MPGRIPQMYSPRTTVDASPAAAAETIIATFTGIDTVDADSVVTIDAFANFTVGTTGTAARLRLRQSGIAGNVVGDTGAITGGIAAAAVVTLNVFGVDRPGQVASMIYVLTLQVTGGTAISTVSAVVVAPLVA